MTLKADGIDPPLLIAYTNYMNQNSGIKKVPTCGRCLKSHQGGKRSFPPPARIYPKNDSGGGHARRASPPNANLFCEKRPENLFLWDFRAKEGVKAMRSIGFTNHNSGIKKAPTCGRCLNCGCGGRNRTSDLEVMSLTSYLCSTPRRNINSL